MTTISTYCFILITLETFCTKEISLVIIDKAYKEHLYYLWILQITDPEEATQEMHCHRYQPSFEATQDPNGP